MRKQNSAFRSGYISQTGDRLYNNDFYASAEIDDFTCYVMVDSLAEGTIEDEAAKLACEAVIDYFRQHPSMGRLHLMRYVQQAQMVLAERKEYSEASIVVAVTNYQKLRYAWAGNTRLCLFRKGEQVCGSTDHSLSWDMAEEGDVPKDRIAAHEERANLTRYINGAGFARPQLSKRIALYDGDILALQTQGFWESCDQEELLSAIGHAGDDLDQTLRSAKSLLLDQKPGEAPVDNFTLALVYIDKAYIDPTRGKKLRTILKIVLVVLMIAVILSVILYFYFRDRRIKTENMEAAYISGIEYIQDENYIKAKESLDTAYALAEKLNDKKRMAELDQYQKLTEAVIAADDLLAAASYQDAQDAYLRAESRNRYTDNLAEAYIGRKLERASSYLSVQDLINLGDTLTEQGNYEMAETKYMEAKRLAAAVYDKDGKQEALDALNLMYEKMREELDADKDAASAEVKAADYILQGDKAVLEGDLTAAELFYTLAREQYTELENEVVLQQIDTKMQAVEQKKKENKELLGIADGYVAEGDKLLKKEKYADAKIQYILARSIYSDLEESARLKEVETKIETVDTLVADQQREAAARASATAQWPERDQ